MGRKKTQAPPPVEVEETRPLREGAKNRPTPKRREAEAARLRPIVPADRKAAIRAERERRREQLATERAAVVAGDERHLGPRDAGPQRRLVRDIVDSRWNFGELYLPIMLLFLVGILVPMVARMSVETRAAFSLWSSLFLYVMIALLAIDSFLMWRRAKAALITRFGADAPRRGLFTYALSRSVMIRRWRRPPAKVARGEEPRR